MGSSWSDCAGRGGEAAELAFSALVERHGPMVLRVCQRVLADPHDAEDAFQAVFLVLARRAESIRSRDSVASWLHGVALRVAAAARAARDRRTAHERRAGERTPVATDELSAGDELGWALQEEIGRMPERYRAAVVLCYLEGRTYDEAARLLGCPVGTVKSRLATAREKLRFGLNRRGLGPPAGFVGGVLAAERARTVVPRRLVEAAVRSATWSLTGRIAATGAVPVAVATLTEGVLKTMISAKLRTAALLLLIVGIGVSTARVGVIAQQSKGTSSGRPRQEIRFPRNFPGATAEDAGDSPADQHDGAKTTTVSRPYYVGDLVLLNGTVPTESNEPPQVDMSPLIELIAASVAPGTWKGYDKRGKPKFVVFLQGNQGDDEQATGSMTPFYLSISLIIRHTEEVHDQIGDRLRQLRRLLRLDMTSPAAPGPESGKRQLNTTPASAPGSEPGVEDRLRAVERKLDRVLRALESSPRGAGDAPSLESLGPTLPR